MTPTSISILSAFIFKIYLFVHLALVMKYPDQHAPMMFFIGPLTLKTKGNITITYKVYFLSKNNAIQPSGSYTTF